jgi:hypothetical protein
VSAERTRDLPQSLPLAANRGPVYLLGTGESVEMAMVTSPVIPAKAGIQGREESGLTLDPRRRGGDENSLPRGEAGASSPTATSPRQQITFEHQWRRALPTCIRACAACTRCRRACARCAAPPPPRSLAPGSRSATASAACSPRRAPSSCRTRRLRAGKYQKGTRLHPSRQTTDERACAESVVTSPTPLRMRFGGR